MTKEIQQRIEEMNPDTVDWNDASTYAALGVGEDDDGTAGEGAPLGDTIEEQAAADAKASAPASAAPEPAKPEQPAKTESSESPNAAAQQKPDEQVDGVATRDGKRIIPYAVLKTTRDELRARELALQEKGAELEKLKEQLAAKAADAGSAAVDKAMANPAKLTEAQIEKIRLDFPEVADALEAMRDQLATVQAAKAEQPKQAAVTEPAKAAPNVEDEDEAFDQGLIANPMLAGWMAKPTEKPWQRAVAIDKMLSQDPEYAGKTYADRFAVVERMVAAELGIAAPKTEPKPEPVLNVAQAPVKQAARPSLSDLGGSAPRSEDDVWAQSTAVDLLARADKMSEQELMRLAGINY